MLSHECQSVYAEVPGGHPGRTNIAQEYGNQQIEQVHLLYALLQQENGLIPQLLTKMGLTLPSFEAAVKAELAKLPKVSVSREAGKVYVSPDFDRAVRGAEETRPVHEGRICVGGASAAGPAPAR